MNIFSVELGDLEPRLNLSELLAKSLSEYFPLQVNDCLVISSSAISIIKELTRSFSNDDEKREIILSQAKRVLRSSPRGVIAQTQHGFICENGGVAFIDGKPNIAFLLPNDLDSEAFGIQQALKANCGFEVPVIIAARFTQPFRIGNSTVALGICGIKTNCVDKENMPDQIASAASLVVKDFGAPWAALLRGLPQEALGNGKGSDLIKSPQNIGFF